MPALNRVVYQSSKRDYACESRSTSAGSRESGECRRGPSQTGLPDYEYPVPFVVRNTFIEAKLGRPDSLDEFYRDRQIHSSPAVTDECKEQSRDGSDAQPTPSRTIAARAHALISSAAASTGFWTGLQDEETAFPTDHVGAPLQMQMPHVLMLSEALPESQLGSPEMPTMGSSGHYIGACKPCAFFYTRGCENGVQCTFCHLCPPDEKRRRQKEKQVAFREMRRQRRQIHL